jgi:hypothetical protein
VTESKRAPAGNSRPHWLVPSLLALLVSVAAVLWALSKGRSVSPQVILACAGFVVLASARNKAFAALGLTLVAVNNPLNVFVISRLANNILAACGLGLVVVLSATRQLRGRRSTSFSTPLDRPFLWFSVLALGYAFYGLLRGNPLSFVVEDLFPFVCFFGFYWVTKKVVRDPKEIQILLVLVGLSGLVRAVYELYLEHAALFGVLMSDAEGLLMDMNIEGHGVPRVMDFMVLSPLLIGLAVLALTKQRPRSWRNCLWLCEGILFYLLILTFFRSLWVGFLVGLLVIWLAAEKKQRRRLAAVVIGFVILFVSIGQIAQAVPGFQGLGLLGVVTERAMFTLDQINDPGASDGASRNMESWDILAAARDSQFLGIGLGGEFMKTFYTKYDATYPEIGVAEGKQHGVFNFFLGILLRMGLLGFAFCLRLIWVAGKELQGLVRRIQPELPQAYAVGLMASLYAYCAALMTFAALYQFPIAAYMGTSIALIFALDHFFGSGFKERQIARPVQEAKKADAVAIPKPFPAT